MLQNRHGLEFSAEYGRNFGEPQVHAIEGNPLVRQGIADAPYEGARRAAVLERQFVQADFVRGRRAHRFFPNHPASASSTLRRLHTIAPNSAASTPNDFHPGNTAVRWERAAVAR